MDCFERILEESKWLDTGEWFLLAQKNLGPPNWNSNSIIIFLSYFQDIIVFLLLLLHHREIHYGGDLDLILVVVDLFLSVSSQFLKP